MSKISYYDLIARIDKVAQTVEGLGYVEEATYLDVVANTLEREAGLQEVFKRGMSALRGLNSTIPAAVKKDLEGLNFSGVVRELIKKVTGGKDFLTKEIFEQLMAAAGANYGIYPDRKDPNDNSRNAGAVSKTIAVILLTIIANAVGKDISSVSYDDYKGLQAELSKEVATNTPDQNVILSKESLNASDLQAIRDSINTREVDDLVRILKKNGARLTYVDPSSSPSGVGGLSVFIGMPEDVKNLLVKENSANKNALINMTAEALFKIFAADKGSVDALVSANIKQGAYFGVLKNTLKNFYSL